MPSDDKAKKESQGLPELMRSSWVPNGPIRVKNDSGFMLEVTVFCICPTDLVLRPYYSTSDVSPGDPCFSHLQSMCVLGLTLSSVSTDECVARARVTRTFHYDITQDKPEVNLSENEVSVKKSQPGDETESRRRHWLAFGSHWCLKQG